MAPVVPEWLQWEYIKQRMSSAYRQTLNHSTQLLIRYNIDVGRFIPQSMRDGIIPPENTIHPIPDSDNTTSPWQTRVMTGVQSSLVHMLQLSEHLIYSPETVLPPRIMNILNYTIDVHIPDILGGSAHTNTHTHTGTTDVPEDIEGQSTAAPNNTYPSNSTHTNNATNTSTSLFQYIYIQYYYSLCY